jgi:serine protease Do
MQKLTMWMGALLLLASAGASAQLPDFTALVESGGPAVVNISTTKVVNGSDLSEDDDGNGNGNGEQDPMFDFFRRFMPPGAMPGMPRSPHRGERPSRGEGSGFIVSQDGFILTNAHVVDGVDEVTVTLTDKRQFRARVVGTDSRTDVALLKIEAANLPRVTTGDPDKLKVGEWVLAIGSPFGFENSVTAGIVSAKGRSLPSENYVPFLQTDVAVNPGNSGGPLFNMRGEVVGINSQIYSRSGGYQGVSFAIPIDVAMDVAEQLKSSGKVARGWLGVVIQEVTGDLAESFGLDKPMGALVAEVQDDSPAARAGILASDVILKFDGKAVKASADLPRMVASARPNAKVPVQVWRKGALKEVSITLGELPTDDAKAARAGPTGKTPDRAGLVLSELTPEQRKSLGLDHGLAVEDAKGAAVRAGVRRGDIILAVNNTKVKTVEEFRKVLVGVGKNKAIALLVKRGDSSLYLPLKIQE